MISLFIDTSVSKLILGLYKDEEVLFYENIDANNDLSSIALKDLNIALNNNGIKAKDIDNIYVSNGPGSFTGIRIGVTIAKTLAYTINKKIYPISELKILASTSTDTNILVPLIDARRGYVYAGIYDQNLKALKEERYIKLEELVKELEGKNVTYISYDNLLNSIVPNPDIIKIINNSDQNVNPHLVKPNYLKKTEVEENYAKKCN